MVFKSAKYTKLAQNQNWDFHHHVFNAIFLLTSHSSIFQIIPWNWNCLNHHKVQGKKIFDTWYYIVTCAMLCVSFSSKSKAFNVFPKYIWKSKAHDQSIQARKKLFWHMEVQNQRIGTQLILLYCGRTVWSSHQRCCIRKLLLKFFQYPQEKPVLESIF